MASAPDWIGDDEETYEDPPDQYTTLAAVGVLPGNDATTNDGGGVDASTVVSSDNDANEHVVSDAERQPEPSGQSSGQPSEQQEQEGSSDHAAKRQRRGESSNESPPPQNNEYETCDRCGRDDLPRGPQCPCFYEDAVVEQKKREEAMKAMMGPELGSSSASVASSMDDREGFSGINLCSVCGVDMGDKNSRQLCGKTQCYNEM